MTRVCPLQPRGRQPSGASTRERKQQHAGVLILDSHSFPITDSRHCFMRDFCPLWSKGRHEGKDLRVGAERRVVHVSGDN